MHEPVPVVLVLVNLIPQAFDDRLIVALRLVVCLWMVSRYCCEICSEKSAQRCEELAVEL